MNFGADALALGLMVGILVLAAQLDHSKADVPAPTEPTPSVLSGLLDLFKWNFNGQAYVYPETLARTANSPINPGNAFAKLPNLSVTGELRPNVQATSQYADLVVQPRLLSVYQTGGVSNQESARGYILQGFLRVKPTDALSASFGRETLAWGPAIFRSPSNPFYFNNERMDPILELSGIDVARVSYAIGTEWTVGAGVVLGSGHGLVADDRYKESAFAKIDYHGQETLGSLIFANLRGQASYIGGYAQATVNDAVLVYGEANTSTSKSGLGVLPAGGGPQFRNDLASRREAEALVGGSYTFENGGSIYAEYLYNGFGYSGSTLRRYFAQSRAASDQQALGGSLAGLATAGLGAAASRATDLLGQHYLYLQLQNNPSQGNTLWRLMAAENLVDHSAQFSFYLEQNISDRISLFSLGVANAGSHATEFGSVLRYSLTLGAKVFLF